MGFFSWIILGGLSGWLASKLTGKDSSMGFFLNIVVGIVGAFIGGAIANFFGGVGITGLNLRSFVLALIGSVVFLAILKVIRK